MCSGGEFPPHKGAPQSTGCAHLEITGLYQSSQDEQLLPKPEFNNDVKVKITLCSNRRLEDNKSQIKLIDISEKMQGIDLLIENFLCFFLQYIQFFIQLGEFKNFKREIKLFFPLHCFSLFSSGSISGLQSFKLSNWKNTALTIITNLTDIYLSSSEWKRC